MRKTTSNIRVIDLFCGIGGLTHGLRKAGLSVVAGIDNDVSCRYGYEYNNRTQFIHEDILNVTANNINKLFGNKKKTIRVLVGCAPCQPFSKLSISKVTKKQLEPLEQFAYLIKKTLPDIVSMENVSGLADTKKYPIFKNFIETLKDCHYEYECVTVDASDYGVPQSRKRLVLLASRLGPIGLLKKTHKYRKVTVRDAIGGLTPIKHGEICKKDTIHRARKLDPINLERIKSTPQNGGNSKSWSKKLKLECHKRKSGMTYRHSVYGRMRWDYPAPTMTTQCTGLGNGRFGHPRQNRAISLREAAIFQTFPRSYRFVNPKDLVYTNQVAKFIGNAVPVRLAVIIGRSIQEHVSAYA